MAHSEKGALPSTGQSRIIGIYGVLLFASMLLFLLSLSFVIWQGIKQGEDEFQKYSHSVHQSLSQNFAINETILDGFAAFLADVGMQDPNRARFYTRTMLQRYPHLYMFQAAQRIENSEVIEFEEKLATQLRQDIHVRRFEFGKGLVEVDVITQRNFYPVVFVEPVFTDGLDILGLDISSIQFIQQAMQQALSTGLASISQTLELSDGSEAFVMIKPSILPGQTIPDQYALIIVQINALSAGHIPSDPGYELSIAYANDDPLIDVKTENISLFESSLFPKLVSEQFIDIGSDKLAIHISKQVSFQQTNVAMLTIIVFITIAIYMVVYMYMKMHLEAERIKHLAEQKLYQQANYDQLTGLSNRHYFEDYFQRILSRQKRAGRKLALLYIDLNDFKPVNDTLGHQVGDALLQEAAAIIAQSIRGDDMASRFGGDEFVVLLDQVNNKDDVLRVIKRLTEIFSGVEYVAGHTVSLSASIGYSMFPDDGETFEEMLKIADKDMYRSKKGNKNKKSNVIEFKDRS